VNNSHSDPQSCGLTNGRYAFSEQQQTKFQPPLYQLTGLERDKIDKEYKDSSRTSKIADILAKEQRVFTIIKKELREIRDKYGSRA